MTVKKPKKPERYGCLSKSLEDFLYLKEDERFDKHKYDVNKYYQRIVKNVENSFSDIMLAYEHLPDEQKNKIDLFAHIESLLIFIHTEEFDKSPDKLISQTRNGLYMILRSRMAKDQNLFKLASPDFERVIDLLNLVAPKNPIRKGAII